MVLLKGDFMKKVVTLFFILICYLASPVFAFDTPPMYGTSYDGLPYVRFDIDATRTCEEGVIKWNADDKTMDICTENGEVTIQAGQEMHVRGTNKTGATLTNGQVVFIDGAQGSRPTFALANATSEDTSERTIGIVTADILNDATGYVTTTGLVRDIDTSGLAAGDIAYLSTTPGGFTNTSPASPNHMVSLGVVVRSHADEGIIYVTVINGFELTELHDVTITSPQVDDSLLYNGTLWENVPHTFGELYYHNDAGTLDFSTTTALINVTGLTNGLSNNMTLNDTNGSITVIDADTYRTELSASMQSASAADFDFHVGVDGVDQDKCHANRRIGTGTDTGNIGITCLLDLAVGEVVTFMVNSAANETIKFEALNWNMDRIP
jgi:hypothetical protein